jgi:hypothetical protein
LIEVLHNVVSLLGEFDSAESQAGGAIAAELDKLLVGKGREYRIVLLAAWQDGQGAVKQSFGWDGFLVEEATVFGGSGYIINADVLIDLTGAGGKVRKVAVG